jgi:hypothetical protein
MRGLSEGRLRVGETIDEGRVEENGYLITPFGKSSVAAGDDGDGTLGGVQWFRPVTHQMKEFLFPSSSSIPIRPTTVSRAS